MVYDGVWSYPIGKSCHSMPSPQRVGWQNWKISMPWSMSQMFFLLVYVPWSNVSLVSHIVSHRSIGVSVSIPVIFGLIQRPLTWKDPAIARKWHVSHADPPFLWYFYVTNTNAFPCISHTSGTAYRNNKNNIQIQQCWQLTLPYIYT